MARIRNLERLACVTALVCGVPLGMIVAKKYPQNSVAKQVRFARLLFEYVAVRQGFGPTEVGNFLGLRNVDTRRLRDLSHDYVNNGWRSLVSTIERVFDGQIVYIAGKVSNSAYAHVVQKFRSAEEKLEKMGYFVVNPVSLVPETANWEFAMRTLVSYLSHCDVICLLPDWRESDGAKFEYELAKRLGLEAMVYEEV